MAARVSPGAASVAASARAAMVAKIRCGAVNEISPDVSRGWTRIAAFVGEHTPLGATT
jgi:hypothetical protein